MPNDFRTDAPRVRLRAALAGQAALLTDIAMRSKGHWGYSPTDLARWREELTLAPATIVACPTWVAWIDESAVGFYQLQTGATQWVLEHLWVHPDGMRRGIGRALLRHAVRLAAEQGAHALAIDADPHAEPFYLACGACRVGALAAPIDGYPDRVRPQLLLAISDVSESTD
ncbi:MAG: GNAT family N-acetyltransferase [Burkholderiaceae bacterium]|nr:GNAT family N-acetyltransferase [Burkholderiaceae bacterium]